MLLLAMVTGGNEYAPSHVSLKSVDLMRSPKSKHFVHCYCDKKRNIQNYLKLDEKICFSRKLQKVHKSKIRLFKKFK